MRRLALRRRAVRWLSYSFLLILAACTASDQGPQFGPEFQIFDASHSGGTPGFNFLPPMVSNVSTIGTFDSDIAAVAPGVAICDVTNGPDVNCGGSGPGATPPVAVYGVGTSPSVVLESGKYKVNWDTKAPGFDAGHTYRVHVIAGTGSTRRDIGFADVLLTTNAGQAKQLATGDMIVLSDGRTLPIQFFIARGVVPRPTLVCDPDRVAMLINGLYPAGPQRDAARQSFTAIQALLSNGNTSAAVAAMFDFLSQVLADLRAGTLLNPLTQLGLTTAEATGELGTQLYACAGVGNQAPPDLGGTLEAGAGAGVVEPSTDPAPQVISTEDGNAVASFPAGSVSQTVLVTITPDPDGTGNFPSELTQYPPFFDFSTFPHLEQFGAPVTVGICLFTPTEFPPGFFDRLQIAHPDPATNRTTIEILHRVAPPPGLCGTGEQIGSAEPRMPAGWMPKLGYLAGLALRQLAPSRLYAVALEEEGGVGGQTSSFTDFRVVDPESRLSFTTEPTNTPVDATITPPVQVAVQDRDGITIASFEGSVTMSITPGTGTEGAVLSGTTTVPVVNGVATFSNLSIDRAGTDYRLTALASSESDPVPVGDTSATFNISGGVTIESVDPNTTTLTIDGPAVDYIATYTNGTGTALSGVVLQNYIDQGDASRAANGVVTMCGAGNGILPPGPCTQAWSIGASNSAAGSGTLVPGSATARVELIQDGVVLATFTFPVTLVVPAGTSIDASGDGGSGADFISASGSVAAGSVTLRARFAGTTFSSATSYVIWNLDTDQNIATGYPGTTNGNGDSEFVGVDYMVRLVGTDFGPLVQIINGSTFASVPNALSPAYVSNGVDVTIPLSLFGGDDGTMNFKLTVQTQLSAGSWTGINDFISNLGFPAGTIAP